MTINYHEQSKIVNHVTQIENAYHELATVAAELRSNKRSEEEGELLSDCIDPIWSACQEVIQLSNENVLSALSHLNNYQIALIENLKKYPIQVGTPHFEVGIDNDLIHGYFESYKEGNDRAGGLWFQDKVLMDYDGVYSLPVEVGNALLGLGFGLGDCAP